MLQKCYHEIGFSPLGLFQSEFEIVIGLPLFMLARIECVGAISAENTYSTTIPRYVANLNSLTR